MSNERHETIDDIVKEIRGNSEHNHALIEVSKYLTEIADRIEAAAKREREAGAEEAQICGEIGEAIGREATCRNSLQVGNAVAMREAITKCIDMITEFGNAEIIMDPLDVITDIYGILKSALSTPPRNCDRPECATKKAAQDTWRKDDGGKTAYYEWLLATSTEGDKK